MRNIAIFASGRGSNFQKIQKQIESGMIPAKIKCLITDNSKAGAIQFAEKHSIPAYTIPPPKSASAEAFGNELISILKKCSIEWIILAGYLKMIPENVVEDWSNKIINIHPALLPAFGGKGMYGSYVHQAVWQSGAKISGVTVHLVNKEYDKGPIVLQRAINIEHCLSPEEIAAEVLKVEHVLYSEAIKKLLEKKYKITGNRVVFTN